MRWRARQLARGALAAIEAARERIDDLNVYPVPDGDTGTNLTLTVRAVAEALEGEGPDGRPGLAREVARAALMGARGNSGVILSQIVRGAADALAVSDDPARIFRAASDAAYRAVRKPVEGTMLTAIRELAEAAERGDDLAGIVAAGQACVARTQDMLPVLREAQVVDAGAAGLVEIVRGIAGVVAGEALPEPPARTAEATIESAHAASSRYRYCTVLVVEGEHLDAAALEAELEQLGDSLLVVGDGDALKVHVHTDDPGRVLSLAVALGTIDGVEIANMQEQAARRTERLLHAVPDDATAVVAVSTGEGNRRLFESAGAVVVDGGATMNPSTVNLLEAIERAPGRGVVLLPNSPNVLLAAEQAAANASRPVRVVASTSLQAGLAALVAFEPDRDLDTNADALDEAVAGVATGAVTVASRDVVVGETPVSKGAWLGLVEGAPVAGGGFDEAVRGVVDRLLAEPRDVLMLLAGDDPPRLEEVLAGVRSAHPDLELELHEGGQPHYALLLAAE
ncbi:MAG TPA: DAK2 domain-containing protein [Gaiellaceae bacterium]